MKILTLQFLFALLIFSGISTAQEKNENLTLVESYEKPNCELLISQLDRLMIDIQNQPEFSGYVVIYGGENPKDNIVWERAVNLHFKLRRYDPKKISVITAKSNQPLKIEIFKSENGAKPNVTEETFGYVLSNEKTIFVANDAISIVKIDEKDTYINFGCEVCCMSDPLDFPLLAKFLDANTKMNVQIKIFNRSRKMANKLAKLISDKAKNDYKISPLRLEIKYAGKGQRDKSDSIEISDVETRLVPQNEN